ncbi:MAG: hypothetical protein HZC29_05780 [Thaumarchaeota archaeon]|nr:hypothetical protein [Nitrososphaerota archaeon]
MLKVFGFNQQPIQGANISITQMARSLPWVGFQRLNEGNNYTVTTTYNKTDSYGYSMLKITPVQIDSESPNTWSEGNYQVIVNIQAPTGNETFERWFCVGGCSWSGKFYY